MITQDINAMEKKPFESPEVKVIEITPRSIIALSPCPEDVCVHVQCTVYCSEYY